MGHALLIYGNWETCRQKPMKLRSEVKVRTRDQETSRTLSGCDKLRHGTQWLKLQGQRAERSEGLREELRETPLLKGRREEGEPPSHPQQRRSGWCTEKQEQAPTRAAPRYSRGGAGASLESGQEQEDSKRGTRVSVREQERSGGWRMLVRGSPHCSFSPQTPT